MRLDRIAVALLLVLGEGSFAGVALGEEVTLEPIRDNTLYEDAEGDLSNGAGENFFVGKNAAGLIRRGLLAFDVSSIPRGSVITDASLTLAMTGSANAEPLTVRLHRAIQDWGEGASDAGLQGGGGAPAAPGDATWIYTFFDDQAWINAGGDYAPQDSASRQVGAEADYVWSSPGLLADLQTWLDSPEVNFGWLLRADESSTVTAKRFGSRENVDPDVRPRLRIVYEAPGAGVIEFDPVAYAVAEADLAVTLKVARTGGDQGSVSVRVSSFDESAVAGTDYLPVMVTVTFGDGELGEKTLEVQILDNDRFQGERTFGVQLSNPTGGAQLGSNEKARVAISDDEDLQHSLYFAQFGNGAGFFSQIVLVSLEDETETAARIIARTDDGLPFEISLGGEPLVDGILDAKLPARGVGTFRSDSEGEVAAGSVTVLSDRALAGVIVFGGPFGLAGVGASRFPALQFSGPVETDLQNGVNTGVAVQNLEIEQIDLVLTLKDPDGSALSSALVQGLAPLGHLAVFPGDLTWDPPIDFTKRELILEVTSSGKVAGTMIQTRPQQFATLPVATTPVVMLEAAKDATLHEDAAGSLGNGAGTGLFVGRSGDDADYAIRRALLAFDVLSLPPGARVDAVELSLFLDRSKDGEPRNVSVHRVLQEWGEGASASSFGEGAAAVAGDATWLHTFFDQEFWGQPGGDFVGQASAELAVGGRTEPGRYTWLSTPGLVDDVQDWIDNPGANFGWLLRGEESIGYTARRFGSREHPVASQRPRLSVSYEVPREGDLHFAQFGNGTGFFSQLTLLNRDQNQAAAVALEIRKDSGEPFEVILNGEVAVGGRLDLTIPPGGLRTLKTSAQGTVEAGAVTVVSESRLSGVVVFGGSFGLAGVGASGPISGTFAGPVEVDLAAGIDTGVAVQNLSAESVTLEAFLLGPDGVELARGELSVPPSGHRSLFVTQFDWEAPLDLSGFQGSLRLTTAAPVAATMIQTRPDQFATLPVVGAVSPASP